jgi:hypothetical protein
MRHSQEKLQKITVEVQDLEKMLLLAGVWDKRWGPGSDEWRALEKMAAMRTYQKALNSLESLVVARLFELTKMNMSRTGKVPLMRLHTHTLKDNQDTSSASILQKPCRLVHRQFEQLLRNTIMLPQHLIPLDNNFAGIMLLNTHFFLNSTSYRMLARMSTPNHGLHQRDAWLLICISRLRGPRQRLRG